MRFVSLLLALIVCGLVAAQTPAAAPIPQTAPAATTASIPDEGPVPVPVPSEKAMQFYHSGNWWWLGRLIWGLVVPAAILFLGFSAWMRDRAAGLSRWWPATLGIYWIFFSVASALIDLPLDYFQGFVRPHAYGVSDQALSKFMQDWTISLVLNCVIGGLLIWVPYLLLRKSPKRWWLYTSLIAVPFIILQMIISPIYIDPLFNKFGPMKDKALEEKILNIADRAGIQGGNVYEVEKSVDTKMVNAYVTGFGGSKRIVLWDTLLQKLDEKEALFVMAHEMGHYVLNHVAKSIFFSFFVLLLATLAIHLLSGALIRRYGTQWGFHDLADPAAMPLIMLMIGIFSIVGMPAIMLYSRTQEHEADRFAIEITRDNHHGATAFVKLSNENLGNPRPDWFVKVWRGSHPTIGDRIDFINDYHPWTEGKPGLYEQLFK